MTERLDLMKASPDAFKAVLHLENYVKTGSGLDARWIHLIKLRASQINGCAYCVDMHTKEARQHGLSEQWIALVCVWREASVFDVRERALLAWTEAVTNLSTSGVPDADYEALRAHFSEEETANLTVAISTINVWNRLAVSFRTQHAVDLAA
ncbi:MAG: carboxymuconolactone decarboxylase family protein [Alphaproteobacteria bacterium]|nr:carboxymuconolactone decarboxylase family protein [Alphaproteobacteria bacterium]